MTRPGLRHLTIGRLLGFALTPALLVPSLAPVADAVPAPSSARDTTTVGPSSVRLGTYNIR